MARKMNESERDFYESGALDAVEILCEMVKCDNCEAQEHCNGDCCTSMYKYLMKQIGD